jgi:hypothetical protein
MTTTTAGPKSLTLCFSPLEAAHSSVPPLHALHPSRPGSTACGKGVEGWRMVYSLTERPNTAERITCSMCKRTIKARARGYSQARE